MKTLLLLAVGLLLAGGFTTARSADSCPTFGIMNASGIPPVVQGTSLRVLVNGFSPSVTVYIDGAAVATIYDVLEPALTPFVSTPTINMAAGSYGPHTMYTNWDTCVLNFTTVVPDPPPPAPPAAPTLSEANGGIACPSDGLSWTSVAGATTYQLYRRQLAPSVEPSMSQVWSGTNRSLRVTAARNWSYVFAVSACGETGCSALSNFKTVTGGTCP